jgi:monoterpene epsilon-lactone hydrolase
MAGKEIEKIKKIIESYPDFINMPVQELREISDKNARWFPIPETASCTEIREDGITGEWIRAKSADDDRIIMYLHGGGYVTGSPRSHRHLAWALSEAASASVFSLEYRLAPEHPFPAAVEDAIRAYRWLITQHASDRIAIAGDSAGGGLTVVTMVSLRDDGIPLPAAGICISPWTDLTCSSESYISRGGKDPLIRQKEISRFATMYLDGKDPKNPLASPLYADLRKLPPLLIQVGSDEVLFDDAVGLDRRAKKANVKSTIEIWSEMVHVWHIFYPMLKEGRDAIRRIGEFILQRVP